MTKYQITPMTTAPDTTDDYCVCDEQHATRWAINGEGVLFESRAEAEERKHNLERADRYKWGPGDVEHHG